MQRINKYVPITNKCRKVAGDSAPSRHIFLNMIHTTKILYYTWRPELNAYSPIDTKGNAPLHFIIGQTLASLFTQHNDCTQGIQLARLKIGCSTIVAFKRVSDIKVTIDTITNN